VLFLLQHRLMLNLGFDHALAQWCTTGRKRHAADHHHDHDHHPAEVDDADTDSVISARNSLAEATFRRAVGEAKRVRDAAISPGSSAEPNPANVAAETLYQRMLTDATLARDAAVVQGSRAPVDPHTAQSPTPALTRRTSSRKRGVSVPEQRKLDAARILRDEKAIADAEEDEFDYLLAEDDHAERLDAIYNAAAVDAPNKHEQAAEEDEFDYLLAEDDHAERLDAIYNAASVDARKRAAVANYFKHMTETSENYLNVPQLQVLADSITPETINSILLFVCNHEGVRYNQHIRGHRTAASLCDYIYAFINNPDSSDDDKASMPFMWCDDGPFIIEEWHAQQNA